MPGGGGKAVEKHRGSTFRGSPTARGSSTVAPLSAAGKWAGSAAGQGPLGASALYCCTFVHRPHRVTEVAAQDRYICIDAKMLPDEVRLRNAWVRR